MDSIAALSGVSLIVWGFILVKVWSTLSAIENELPNISKELHDITGELHDITEELDRIKDAVDEPRKLEDIDIAEELNRIHACEDIKTEREDAKLEKLEQIAAELHYWNIEHRTQG